MASLGKVVLAEGQEWERIVEVPYPKGRKWRELSPKLMAFVLDVSKGETGGVEVDIDDMLASIGQLWDTAEFEDVYVPAVFGLEDEAGRKYLNEECVMMDIMYPFFEAAAMIIEASMGRQDTQAALGKSQGGNKAKAQAQTRSQNTN